MCAELIDCKLTNDVRSPSLAGVQDSFAKNKPSKNFCWQPKGNRWIISVFFLSRAKLGVFLSLALSTMVKYLLEIVDKSWASEICQWKKNFESHHWNKRGRFEFFRSGTSYLKCLGEQGAKKEASQRIGKFCKFKIFKFPPQENKIGKLSNRKWISDCDKKRECYQKNCAKFGQFEDLIDKTSDL